MLRSVLRFAAGIVAAAVVWSWVAPSYVVLVARPAQALANVDPRLRHLDAKPQDGTLILRGGAEAPDLPLGTFPAEQVTYNVILLVGLFATVKGLLRGRTMLGFLLALFALYITHVIAVAAGLEYTYATTAGAWSDAHYGGMEQDFWKAIFYAYQLAGMFAVAFALWWISGPSEVRKGRALPAA